MRVLITGAGGFVCSSVASVLLEAGHEVVALDRAFDEAACIALDHPNCTRIEADLERGALPDLPCDALIHGAAITARPEDLGQSPEENLRANLHTALAASEWAARKPVRRAILISSAAVIAESPEGPIDEEYPVAPRGPYAVAKRTLELWAETLRALYARDVIAVRFSGVYGPREVSRRSRPRVTRIGQLAHEAVTRGTLTIASHEPPRDWTFAPDIGRALLALLVAPRLDHALYHVASEQVYTPLEVAQAIQRHLPNARIHVIDSAADPAVDKRNTNGAPPRMAEPARRGYLSSARLRRDTGFADWTPLDDGLAQTLAWFEVYRV